MNTLTFIKYCIVDGLKVCFPKTTLGLPKEREEIDMVYDKKPSNFKISSDYVDNGLYSKSRHYGR